MLEAGQSQATIVVIIDKQILCNTAALQTENRLNIKDYEQKHTQIRCSAREDGGADLW